MTSLERYAQLRRRGPDVEILMGTGNLTELTDADSGGVTAILIGICAELAIRNVLIVQVSPHTRRTVEEHDAARRLMYRAREDNNLPKGYGNQLLSLHDVRPYPDTPEQIAEEAAATSKIPTFASRPRSMGCTSTTATATTSPPIHSLSSTGSASRKMARMRSISATSWPRRRLPAPSASVMRRTVRSIGASPPTARPMT